MRTSPCFLREEHLDGYIRNFICAFPSLVGLGLKPEHIGYDVTGEQTYFLVVLCDCLIVSETSHGDSIFCALKLIDQTEH